MATSPYPYPLPPVPLVVAIYGGQTSNINLSQKNFWGPFSSQNSTFYFLKSFSKKFMGDHFFPKFDFLFS